MPGITKNQDTKKVKQACDECHKRRVKCDYNSLTKSCVSCQKLDMQCAFHRVPLKRGPNTGSRKDKHGYVQKSFNTTVLSRPGMLQQLPISPRNSVNGLHSSSRRSSTASSVPSRSSSNSGYCSSSSSSHCDEQTQIYRTLTMIDEVYNAQSSGEWIPVIPMQKSNFVSRVTKVSSAKVSHLLYNALRILLRAGNNGTSAKTHKILAALSEIQFSTLSADDTIVVLVALTMVQVTSYSSMLMGLTVGVYNDTKGKLQSEEDQTCIRRIELLLNVLDLLYAEPDSRLITSSVLGFTHRFFNTTEISSEMMCKLQFFEALREVQCTGTTEANIARLQQFMPLVRLPNNSLSAQYMRLVITKYQFVSQIDLGHGLELHHTSMISQMNDLFSEIKQVLTRIVRDNSYQHWFVSAIVAECKRDVNAMRQLPAFILKNIVSRQSGLASMNTKRISDNEILQVTQSMNDLVECTGLLGGLLGENLLASTNTAPAIVLTAQEQPPSASSTPATVPRTIPAETSPATRSVLNINQIINHDTSLPILVAQRLSNN